MRWNKFSLVGQPLVDGYLIKTVTAVFLLVAALPGRSADSARTVNVTGGKIQGTMLDKGGAVFKGIPEVDRRRLTNHTDSLTAL